MQLHRLVNLAGAHSLRSKPKGEDSFGTNALPRRTIETHGDRAKDSAHYVPQRGKRCGSRGQVRPRCQADDGAETPRNVLRSKGTGYITRGNKTSAQHDSPLPHFRCTDPGSPRHTGPFRNGQRPRAPESAMRLQCAVIGIETANS